MRPSRPQARPWAVAPLLLVATALASCGGGASETVDAALLCDDIAVLDESIQAFEDLVPATASVEDYREAWDTIEDAYQVVVADRDALAEESANSLSEAHDDLSTAIGDLPDDANMADAAADLQPELEALRTAHDSVTIENECIEL
jgi:hypothetical protein